MHHNINQSQFSKNYSIEIIIKLKLILQARIIKLQHAINLVICLLLEAPTNLIISFGKKMDFFFQYVSPLN